MNQTFAVVTYAPDGTIRTANHRFLRWLGCSLDEIVGQDACCFISSTATRNRQIDLWRRLAGGEMVTEIGLWIAGTGKEVWLESRFVPIVDDAGKVEAVVQIADDVGQRLEREVEAQGQIAAAHDTLLVAQFSLDGRVLAANDLFLQAMGYRQDEVLGQRHAMFLDPAQRTDPGHAAFWTALAAGRHRTGEFRRVAKDGSDRWLQALYSPIRDPAGRVVKIVEYANDITADKVRRADYQWQITAIHKSNCVVTFDMYGSILDANELFLEATGYALEEIRGRHHKMFVDPSHAHGSDYAGFWNDLRCGRHRAGQYKRFGKDGREVWLQATYNPVFDAGGRPVKVVKYASVVTHERLLQAEHQGQIAAINHAHCVIAFDLDGTILDANENFLETMGYRYAEVRGRHHRMFVEAGQDQAEDYAAFWSDLAAGRYRAGEYKRIAKDGREVWLQATYNPICDMNGRVVKIVKYATDITREKLQRADYQGQIEAIQKSQDVAVFALDGTILDMNDRFLATLGYERRDLVGRHHSVLVDRDVAASAEYDEFWRKLKSGNHHSGLYRRVGKRGKEIWIQASYNPILDLSGRPSKVVKFATDVSANVALAEAFAEAKRQAHLDSATSLPNRAKLASFMNSHLADAAGTMAVFYIDLDHFKRVNDAFGHRIGDRVLGEVADRLRRALREDQLVARVGGDEFVIAAPGMGPEAVERFCRGLEGKLTAPIVGSEGQEIVVGLSMGIALAPADGSTPDELLRAADAALHRSKQNGRGMRSYFSDDLNTRLHGQRKLIEDMRNSFTAGDFYLEFQPRFDPRTRAIRSAEALVRWAHPERGRVSPADFIPLAEQSGLIVPLGEWILRSACAAAARWGGLAVSVNVSPVQFSDDALVQKVRDAMQAAGLAEGQLELEITEGVLVHDGEHALKTLNALKAAGVRLAIDDFGTGYSSLSYLRNFPFDVIKIDRSFVRDLDAPASSRPIVQAILALGRALGMSVTAEGVETVQQLALLGADDCDEVQGFLLSLPLPAQDVDRLVERRSSGQALGTASSVVELKRA